MRDMINVRMGQHKELGMKRCYVLLLSGVLLAGCSSTGFERFGSGSSSNVTAAPTTPVQSQTLNPLVGGTPTYDAQGNVIYTDPNYQTRQPINNAMGAEAEFTQPDASGQTGAALAVPSNARTLVRTDLLGAWTLASGAEQCKLNVNLTNWTGGYRASTRGCISPDLQRVNAWRLVDKQVVLIAEDGVSEIARFTSNAPARFDGQAVQDGRAVSFFR